MGLLCLRTPRLCLLRVDAAIVRADAGDRALLARLIDAVVPHAWPTLLYADHVEQFAALLDTDPQHERYPTFYFILDDGREPRTLVGSGGFMAMPEPGSAMLGYSLIHTHQRRGLTTEAVAALVRWAFDEWGKTLLVADTFADLTPSIRVLEKNGFTCAGDGGDPGSIRFELRRAE